MSELNIQTGLLEMVVTSMGSIEGKKPIPLAVKIVRAQRALGEYLDAWRKEELGPAIKEFTDGEDIVPEEDVQEFMDLHEDIFEAEITIEVDTFTVEELTIDGLVIDDFNMRLLLQVGLVVE